MAITLNVSPFSVLALSDQEELARISPFSNTNCVSNVDTVAEAVIGGTYISVTRKYEDPLCTNSLTIPAVVVPVALIITLSIREPFVPPVYTVPIVPVPSLLELAVDIAVAAIFGVAANAGFAAMLY